MSDLVTLRQVVLDMADALEAIMDDIDIYRAMRRSGARKHIDLARAVALDMQRRAGHIAGNARALATPDPLLDLSLRIREAWKPDENGLVPVRKGDAG